jgi:hypothetical protein
MDIKGLNQLRFGNKKCKMEPFTCQIQAKLNLSEKIMNFLKLLSIINIIMIEDKKYILFQLIRL